MQIQISAGKMLKVGTKIKLSRPSNLEDGPGWVSETMDYLLDQILTISKIEEPTKFEPYIKILVKENPFILDIKWVRPII